MSAAYQSIAHYEIESTYDAVREVLSKLMGVASSSIDEENAAQLELCLAETLNNIVEHAYKERNDGAIDVTFGIEGEDLRFDIVDTGVDNLTGKKPQLKNDQNLPGDLLEGGYGRSLIEMIASSAEYRREGDRNITTIRKSIR